MAIGSPKGTEGLPISEINVTPLVDVMLVLLIIFMVTAPMMDQGLSLTLPQTKGSPLESNLEKQWVLKISKDRSLMLNQMNIRVPDLRERLEQLAKSSRAPTLYVRADKDVPYGFVAYVMGEVKATGISKVGLVTVPLESKTE